MKKMIVVNDGKRDRVIIDLCGKFAVEPYFDKDDELVIAKVEKEKKG